MIKAKEGSGDEIDIKEYLTAFQDLRPVIKSVTDMKFCLAPRHKVGDPFVTIRNLSKYDGKEAKS